MLAPEEPRLSEANHDTSRAVEFLCGLPGFPVVTFVAVDEATGEKGRVETRSFPQPVDRPALHDYIERHQRLGNLYYALNPLREPKDRKAERTDVAALAWLHVDLDPRVGETPEQCVERVRARLEGYALRPTLVVASGGGLQAMWRLAEPVPLDGTVEAAEDAKLWNLQLERDLGGDACHNIDRVLRIPYTWNCPDARKIKRGRQYAVAHVLWDDGPVHDIAAFTKAEPVVVKTKSAGPGAGPGARGKSDAPARFRAETVYDPVAYEDPRLQLLNAEWVGLARYGDTDKKYYDGEKEDRSRALFAFCVAAAKASVPDEVVAAIITDPHWAISASVLDKTGAARKREIGRVISRAKVAAINEDLERMNRTHAVVLHGTKCLVATEQPDPVYQERTVFSYLSFEAFRQFYNKWEHTYEHGGKLVTADLGDWWLENKMRRQFRGLTFNPAINEDEVDERLNLWQGLALSPEPGDKHLTFLEHVRENICGGDETVYHYVVCWLARMIQQPYLKGEVAIVMRGDRGVGKTFFADMIGKLFGRHYITVVNSDHLVGKFNAHLQDCVFMHADECLYAGDRKHDQILKALITGNTLRIEPKGIDTFECVNYLHLIMSSNNRHTIPAGDKERRYLALHVKPNRIQDHAWFKKITHELQEEGGLKNLLHFLLGVDITNFEVRKVPDTDELEYQKQQTRHGIDALVEQLCHDGVLPFAFHADPSVALTVGASTKVHERDGFFEWCMSQSTELRYKGRSAIGKLLSQDWQCSGAWRLRARGLRGVKFPPLATLRAIFDRKHGPQEWPEQAEWEPGERAWGQPVEMHGPRRDDVPDQDDIPF
jgi:hypothetical protein